VSIPYLGMKNIPSEMAGYFYKTGGLMRILAISGGTRNGNNDSICKEALLAAQRQGAEVRFIRLLDLDLKHCTGCGFCMKSLNLGQGGGCTLRDDFEWLRSEILDADGLLFSIPVFEKGAAGIFHTLLDRFGPRSDIGTNILGKKISEEKEGREPDPRLFRQKVAAYLGTGGTDYVTRFQCDCQMLSTLMLWNTIACEVFDWTTCFEVEDERIARVHSIGMSLAQGALEPEHAKFMGKPGICPQCGNSNFFLQSDGRAECCICGIKGYLEANDRSLRFCCSQDQLEYAYNTLKGKIHHAEDIRSNQARRTAIKGTELFKQRKQDYIRLFPPISPPKNNQ